LNKNRQNNFIVKHGMPFKIEFEDEDVEIFNLDSTKLKDKENK